MPRIKSADEYTQINLRMRSDTLWLLDAIAHENCNDRSAEINRACAFWVESDGNPSNTQDVIDNLKQEINELQQSVDGLRDEIRKLSLASERDRETMMRIIENLTDLVNRHNI